MYRYEDLKPKLFTDEGQRQFLEIRDRANALLKQAGAFTSQCATAGSSGDGWLHLACIDRMVELGEIKRVTPTGSVWAQHEVFTR